MRHRLGLGALLLMLVPALSGLPAAGVGPLAPPAVAAEQAPVAGSATGPDPYWPLDGNGGTDARHYDVRVAYDFARGVLRGRTTVSMRATRALSSFHLDLLLPVTAVKVNGVAARFSKPNRHEVRIVPRRAIAAGRTFAVQVDYRGRPAPLAYAGERNWLADSREVVSMNQPHMAPWWFPSNDHPTDKAAFDVRVTVPRSKVVIGNGLRVGRTVSGASATTHWRTTQPMATYLAFFAAGDFAVEASRTAAGILSIHAVSRALPVGARASAMRALRRTPAITDWLASRFGPFPFTSTGGLVTSLNVGFALENQTRPTYPGSLGAVGDDLLVHELAHQWFGDSLAVRRWRDIWLNEGFATFAEHLYDAAHGGPSVAAWVDDAYTSRCSAPDDSFWTLRIDDPGAANIFDTAVYERGALALGALQNRIGAAAMQGLLRAWAAAHRNGNVSSPQFEAFAAARTGEDLSGFFDAWLRGGRPPAVTADNGLRAACPVG